MNVPVLNDYRRGQPLQVAAREAGISIFIAVENGM